MYSVDKERTTLNISVIRNCFQICANQLICILFAQLLDTHICSEIAHTKIQGLCLLETETSNNIINQIIDKVTSLINSDKTAIMVIIDLGQNKLYT